MTKTSQPSPKRGSALSALSHRVVSRLSIGAVLLVCLLTWQAAAAYGTGIPNVADQELGMLQFVGRGPIQIEVVDPEGRTVSRGANEIDGAVFTDENDEVTIVIPQRIVGMYEVHVNLDGSSARVQRFDVSVSDGVETIALADREMIVNAPSDPYRIQSDAEGFRIAPEEEEPGLSTTLLWALIGGAAVILVGGFVLIARSRKRKS